MATLVSAVLRFGSNLVLTRLVAPEAFGVMLIVNSLLFTLNLLSETGIRPFLLRTPDAITPRYRSALWTVSVLRGAVLSTLIFFGAPLAAVALAEPLAEPALRIASFVPLLIGLKSHAPLVTARALKERKNAVVELAGTFLSLPLMIGLTYWLRDYRGLVWGLVIGQAVATALTYLCYQNAVVRPRWDAGVGLQLWRFSRFIAASSAVTVVVTQTDKVVVLGVLPLAIAGFYALAVSFASVAQSLVDGYAQKIYMPTVARRMHERAPTADDFYAPFGLMRQLLALGPAAGIVAAPALINLILPPDYALVGPFLSVLLFGPLLAGLVRPIEAFFVVAGMTRTKFTMDLARLAWLPLASMVGLAVFGVWGVVWAAGLLNVGALIIGYAQLLRHGYARPAEDLKILIPILLGLVAGFGTSIVLEAVGRLIAG